MQPFVGLTTFELMILFLLTFILLHFPPSQEILPVKNETERHKDSLTVYIFLLDECVISQFYTPVMNGLFEKHRRDGIGFIGYFPHYSSKPDEIEAFGKTYGIKFPLKPDNNTELSRKFGMKVTPEVAVWDHRTDKMIYRGRIDDSYVRVGKRKSHPQHHDLKNIISDWLDGKIPSSMIETQAIGCFINFDKPYK